MEYFMARRPRRNHSNDFKAKVALAAIKAEKTLAEFIQQIIPDLSISEVNTQLDELAEELIRLELLYKPD